LKGFNSEITGFFYFAGSLLRWPAQHTSDFLYFHGYILFIYALFAISGLGLVLLAGALAPLFFAIYKGLPLDCLDYQAAMLREGEQRNPT